MAKRLRLQTPSMCSKKMDVKNVTFCSVSENFECKLCDEHFEEKHPHRNTTFHQIKHDLTSYETDDATMVVDLGCPNSVLGKSDVQRFIKSLSHLQQENLQFVSAEDKFKFGPSGPYRCDRKMKIPIGWKGKTMWVTVAIVDARIPMLLGNNILKPMEAKIKLFSAGNGGNGILMLEDEELELIETKAGHYTVKVSDLGKLCKKPVETQNIFECKRCEKVVKGEDTLGRHNENAHEKCDDSENLLNNRRESDLHIERIHGNCKNCVKVSKVMGNLELHIDKQHSDCKTCNQMRQTKIGVCLHEERKHANCSNCAKGFKRMNEFMWKNSTLGAKLVQIISNMKRTCGLTVKQVTRKRF